MASRVEAMCQVMEHLVTHWRHGYSQPGRYGDGTTELVGTCIGPVSIAGGDRDCTSSTQTAMEAAGLPTGGFTYTGNATLLGGVGWTRHALSDGPQRGDVLWYHRSGSNGHMAVHLGGGRLAEFYLSETGGIDGQVGDQTSWESRIADYYDPGWDGFYRWENDEQEDDMTPEQDAMLREVHHQLTRTDTAGHDNPQGHDFFGRIQIIEHQITRTDAEGHIVARGHDFLGILGLILAKVTSIASAVKAK